MKPLLTSVAVVLVLATAACSGPQLETQTFELQYLDANTAASLIEPYI